MRCSWRSAAFPVVLVLLAPAGCRDKAKELSNAHYLLARQHQTWNNARESMRSDQPNLGFFRSIDIFLRGRTHRRVGIDYEGPNKQEVLDRLESLRARYEAEVLSLLDMTTFKPGLKPGVTIQQVRKAFEGLHPEYTQLEAVTAPR